MEASGLPTVLNILEDIPYQCPIIKNLITDVSVDWMLMGLALLLFTIWLLRDVCYTGNLSMYSKSLPAVLERMAG